MMVSETLLSLLNFLLNTTPTEKINARAKFTSCFENFVLLLYFRA